MNTIKRHEQMRNFIAHRERVLETKSVINCRPISRSKSAPNRQSSFQVEQQRQIQRENQRLLQSLVKISLGKSQYSKKSK